MLLVAFVIVGTLNFFAIQRLTNLFIAMIISDSNERSQLVYKLRLQYPQIQRQFV